MINHFSYQVFGVHGHGEDDGHDHGSGEIVVEEFLKKSIVIVMGRLCLYIVIVMGWLCIIYT